MAREIAHQLRRYARDHGYRMAIVFVNPDHVHVLIELPTDLPISALVQGLKGSSSHWINTEGLLPETFSWSKGYGVFAVSYGHKDRVWKYIANQEEHHRGGQTYDDEMRGFCLECDLDYTR